MDAAETSCPSNGAITRGDVIIKLSPREAVAGLELTESVFAEEERSVLRPFSMTERHRTKNVAYGEGYCTKPPGRASCYETPYVSAKRNWIFNLTL